MGSVTLPDAHWVMPIAGQPLPDKELIGGKAWSIARMSTLGLPVPPAFVVTTRACVAYLQTGAFPGGLVEEIAAGIAWLESQTDRRFGSGPRPLLVSVRSGAPVSMPGMMDTILNLGINDATERLLAADCNEERFARDTHRRFIELYAAIVLKVDPGVLGSADDLAGWRQAIAAAETSSSNCTAQCARCSNRGTPAVPAAIASTTASLIISVRLSWFRQWSSATWTSSPARACCSLGTP